MKTFTVLCVTLTLVNANKRLCPSGFTYLGDDETEDDPFSKSKSYWLEEIDRSPTYSCYKIQKAGNGLNEAWNKCEHLEGHLLALNNDGESWLRRASQFLKNFNHNKTYLTSGFYFKDVEKWMWFGTNDSVNTGGHEIEGQDDSNQCLSIRVTPTSSNASAPFHIGFVATKCLDETEYICEVRAQTVTYRAWFYSNWLTLLLALMVTALLITLVVSLFKYNTRAKLYRGRHNSAGIPRPQNAVHPFDDAPPSYRDVTGLKKESAMDGYINKGRETLAKVTVYKNSST